MQTLSVVDKVFETLTLFCVCVCSDRDAGERVEHLL